MPNPGKQGKIMPISRLLTRAVAMLALACAAVSAQQLQTIQLPTPQTTGGKPLMQALAARQTTRAFRDQPLPLQALSNLLWAAFGVNRPAPPNPRLGRTAPSAMNRQEIEIMVVLPQGAYLYDAPANSLRLQVSGDQRTRVGAGEAAHATVTLVYVAPVKADFAQVDVGFIGQNVYLFAASEGLNAWFYALHGAQDAAAISAALKLPADKIPLYAQSVGYPPK